MNDNWLFVAAAFTVTWMVLLGYLMHLRRTLRRAQAMMTTSPSPGNR